MKILIIRTGGKKVNIKSGIYNYQEMGLAKSLVMRGHTCDIVFPNDYGVNQKSILRTNYSTLTFYQLSSICIHSFAIYNERLYKLCEKYDVLQVSEIEQITSYLIAKRFPNKTVIYNGPYINNETFKYWLKVSSVGLWFFNDKRYLSTQVISKSLLSTNYCKCNGFKNVETIGVGLDLEPLVEFSEDKPIALQHLKKNKNNVYFLYVGQIIERKNILYILSIIKEIKNRTSKNIKLLIIGKIDKNNKYYKKCIYFINANNIKENVIFFGEAHQSQLKYFYKISAALIAPSVYEIFGMTFMEAMYFGTPVITSPNGGSSMLIKNGYNGFVITLDKKEQWIKLLIKIIDNNNLSTNVKKKANETIMKEFLWSKLASRFENVYEKLVLREEKE